MITWGVVMALPSFRLGGRRHVRGGAGERLAVYLVGIEPAQLLGQQFRGLPAMQCHMPVGLARPAQSGCPAIRPADRDITVADRESHLGDARATRVVPA